MKELVRKSLRLQILPQPFRAALSRLVSRLTVWKFNFVNVFYMILTSTIATTDSMWPGLVTYDFFTQDREECSQGGRRLSKGEGEVHKVGPI